MIKKILLVILFLSAMNVEAAIDTVNIVGSTIAVEGSGFGSHTDYGGSDEYLNYLWEQCDYSGSSLTNAKWANKNSGRARLSNSYAHSGGYSLSHRVLPTAISEMNCFGYTVNTTVKYHVYTQPEDMPEIFTSEWVLLKEPFEMSSNDQAKLLAIVVTSDGINVKNWMHIDTTPNVTNPDGWYVGSHAQESDRTDSTTPLIEGVWARLDMYLNRDTGLYQCWVNGSIIRDGNVYDESGYVVTALYEISFINYIADYSGGDKEYFTDDMFVNFTRARVEIGDAPIFANCTHREIQPALTWSDTGITGTLNIGSFAAYETVYFFVVDADGVASSGKLVNLSGTPTYDLPTITGPDDFSTTESSAEVNGTYYVDPDLADQSVIATWTLGEASGFCVAALGVFSCTVPGLEFGANTVTVEIVDSNAGRAADTVIVTRTLPFTLKTHGNVNFKNTTLH